MIPFSQFQYSSLFDSTSDISGSPAEDEWITLTNSMTVHGIEYNVGDALYYRRDSELSLSSFGRLTDIAVYTAVKYLHLYF